MNYSMMAYAFANYGKKCIYMGCFAGGVYLAYGFGLLRGERRALQNNPTAQQNKL